MNETNKSETSAPIFGIRPVMEAIREGKNIEKILIQKGLRGENFQELFQLVRERGVYYQHVPIEKLNRLTRKNHQGVFAFLSDAEFIAVEDLVPSLFEQGLTPLLVVLDRVTDVRNLGAIARTAECMGAHGLVVPERGSAPMGPDAVKTSAGALQILPVCRERNLKNTLRYLKESGFTLVACTEKGKEPLFKANFTGPLALVMGSEEDGISPEYLKLCDTQVLIPMTGKVSSLNVSVAAGMLLYEIARQRTAAHD